jgi:hypothetical protein
MKPPIDPDATIGVDSVRISKCIEPDGFPVRHNISGDANSSIDGSSPMWIVLLTAIAMPVLAGVLLLRVQMNGGMQSLD